MADRSDDLQPGPERVVAAEVELLRAGEVDDAAVLARTDCRGRPVLVAYCTGGDPASIERTLTSFAEARGAAVSVVSVFGLPRIALGEIDVASLARSPAIDRELVATLAQQLGLPRGRVHAGDSQRAVPPVHLSELLTVTTAVPRPRPPPAQPRAGRPAIADGGAIAVSALPTTLRQVLRAPAASDAELLFLRGDVDQRSLRGAEVVDVARRIAAGLERRGVAPATRVLLALPDHQSFLGAFWGCVEAGAVAMPSSCPRRFEPSDVVARRLCDVAAAYGVRHAITVAPLAPLLARLLPGIAVMAHEELASETPSTAPPADPAPDAIAVAFLTSGSTGLAKAVPLTHRNLCASIVLTARANQLGRDDVSLNWMPFDHPGPLIRTAIRPMWLGCRQVHADTAAVLDDPLRWLDWIERHAVTTSWAPNFAFGLVADAMARTGRGRRWDLSSMRCLLDTAEPIVIETVETFARSLADHGLRSDALVSSWGMAETSSSVTFARDFVARARAGDSGTLVDLGAPIPGISLRVVDDLDRVVDEGSIGHLQVRGVTVTPGYLEPPPGSEPAFTDDGWFRTGDLAVIADGSLALGGRHKEIVIVGGVNRACHEIEAAAESAVGVDRGHVAAFAARGAGDPADVLVVVFCPTDGADDAVAATIARIRRAIADRVGLRADVVLPVPPDAFPRTSLGKPQRRLLREAFERGELDRLRARIDVLIGAATTLPSWFFSRVWLPRPARTGTPVTGQLVVIGDDAGIASAIARAARPGLRVIRITGGAELEAGLARLARDGIRIDHVVHLDPGSTEVADVIAPLSALARALDDPGRRAEPATLLAVSRFAQPVLDRVDEVVPERAAAIGFLNAMAAEAPPIRARHVDIGGCSADIAAAHILAELGEPARSIDVAYRDGQRLVSRLRRTDLRFTPEAPPLAAGALHVLLGGSGGIGVEIARWLVRDLDSRVLLIGRDREAGARAVAGLGPAATHAAVDVRDRHALRAAIATAAVEHGAPPRGIFQLAGTLRTALAAEEEPDAVAGLVHTKLVGLTSAVAIASEYPDCFVATFSSVSGVLPAVGKAAYCAASCAADSLAELLRARAGVRVYSLAWSMWQDVGMAPRGAVARKAAAARGLEVIPVRDGIHSLHAALRRAPMSLWIGLDERSARVAAHVDRPTAVPDRLVIERSSADGAPLSIADRFGHAIPIEVASPAAQPDQPTDAAPGVAHVPPSTPVEQTLAAAWQEALGVRAIGVHDSFFAVGGDSLAAARVVRLARERGIELTMERLFERPTIHALAASASAVAPPPPVVSGAVGGRFPLTPMQLGIAELYVDPDRAPTGPRLYQSREPIDLGRLEQALRLIVDRHDALRAVIAGDDEQRWQEIGPAGTGMAISPAPIPQRRAGPALVEAWRRSLSALDPGRGVNLVASPFVEPDGACHQVGLMVSHLVSDLLSQEIIERELLTAYDRLGRSEPVELPRPTASVREHADRLAAAIAAGEWLDQLPYWRRRCAEVRALPPLPCRESIAPPRVETRLVAIGPELREQLTVAAERVAGHGALPIAAWAAALRAIAIAKDRDDLFVHMLENGRECDRLRDVDVGYTVGAFPTYAPLIARACRSAVPDLMAGLARQLAEQRADVGDGFGYAALRGQHRRELSLTSDRAAANGIPLNWWGDTSRPSLRDGGSLSRRPPPGSPIGDVLTTFPISITGFVADGGLWVVLSYRNDVFGAEVEQIAQGVEQGLAALAAVPPGLV